MNAWLAGPASPEHRAHSRGGLFELIELYLKRRLSEMAVRFH